MKGDKATVKPEDWQKYLQQWGFQENDFVEVLRRAENLTADRLDADQKIRLSTFLKGTKQEASLDDVKAAFVRKLQAFLPL